MEKRGSLVEKIASERPRLNHRMQSVECFRLLASMLVVFIHCESIGGFGMIMNCLARVAVPYFFVVSGYFAYHVREKAIQKRFWSVVKLTVLAHLLYLLWDGNMKGIRDLGSLLEWALDKCSTTTLMEILLINRGPVRGFLWYLFAIVSCYAVLWLYVRWAETEDCDYKPLYITGVFLYVFQVVLGSFATASGFEISYRIYRNALLFGLPMFTLGLFLREYGGKILRVYNLSKWKLILLVIVGACLSVIQWKGTGKVEMPVGTLLEVIALMLLLVSVPAVSKASGWLARIISTFGTLSTYIYITHMIWADVYGKYIKGYVLRLGESAETFLYPFSVIGLTLITGILYLCIRSGVNRISGKVRSAKREKF